MKRNLIPGLQKVDWSDTRRENEYVNSVVSALGALGERLDYDTVCAVSGSAFRTSFSMPSAQRWNLGNYHVVYAPSIIAHTFWALGYRMTSYARSDFVTDSKRIMDSIDRGVPVITLEGVINCADACVVSGYDNDGHVLLGYSPFMYIEDDHGEAPDDTGYFRKTGWDDNFEPYLNVMCNYKQYLDRRYAVRFLPDHGRGDLAGIYERIAGLCVRLGELIPQDFSAAEVFSDRERLRPYSDVLFQIADLEAAALMRLG